MDMQLTEHLTSSSSLRSAKSESELSSSHSLTAHFSVAEFQRSATALRLGIDNTVPSTLIPNLSTLCKNVLEPLREHVGEPVIISSGYRCPALNKAVEGVSSSQHVKGEAADIQTPLIPLKGGGTAPNKQKLHDWFLWLENNTDFDQLLFEKSSTSTWIHVSCKPDVSKNRHMVMRTNVMK